MQTNESQVLVVIGSLLETTSDKDEKVRESTYLALRRLGKSHAPEILNSVMSYRKRNPKLNSQEVRSLIIMMEKICDDYIEQLDVPLIEDIIQFSIDESLKLTIDMQFPAADILTILGKTYCAQVVEHLLKHMKTGFVPHNSIIYSIGNLSVINVVAFLPFCKPSLDFIASIIQCVKVDSSRKLYATAVGSISESIVEYRATNDSAVAKETFSPIIENIFEVFVTSWLQTKDNKVCEAVVHAFSSMILLFSSQTLWNETSRIINTFLSLYKRSPVLPRYSVTLCIGNLLTVAPRSSLQPVLDMLLHALHIMVWITPDFAQPLTVKNHSEVLRCYDHIGKLFGDKLCEIILRNLRTSSEQDRVVALLIATHLLGSSDSVIRPRTTDLITILHSLLNENSIKVNKGLVKVIVALAVKEYLTEKDAVFIEFLVKHTYHHNNQTNSETEELESMCNSTVYVLSSTVPAVQPLCWKVLLQMLLSVEYNDAVFIISKSLAHIISKCDNRVLEGYSNHVRPEAVLARSLALLGSPLASNRGVPLLNFLKHYVPKYIVIDENTWEEEIPLMIHYLETSEWKETDWENLVLDAMVSSLVEESKTWIRSFVIEIAFQLAQYTKTAEQVTSSVNQHILLDEKAMLYKCLALFTEYISDEQLINSNIEKILQPVQQHSLLELKSCARSVGILSRSKLDQVLAQLDQLMNAELTRKTSRFLGLLKDSKHEAEMEIARYMICECYSQIIAEAPSKLVLPKLKNFITMVVTQINIAKDSQTKVSCLNIVENIADVVHKNQHIYDSVEECRSSLMSLVTLTMFGSNTLPDITILRIITILVKLEPVLSSTEKLTVLQKCLNKLFQYNTSSPSNEPDNKPNETQLIVQQLCVMVDEMMDSFKSGTMLEEIVNFLQPWIGHTREYHRATAIVILVSSVRCYLKKSLGDSCENPAKFSQLGSLLGTICVRSFEEDEIISSSARECIMLLFVIIDSNEGNIKSESEIQHALFNGKNIILKDFIKVSCHKFPPTQLPYFIESLINGLLDADESCCFGASELLFIIFSEIGSSLYHQTLDIMNSMLVKLIKLVDEKTQTMAVKAILALGSFHRKMFVTVMLNQTLPLHPNICKCWQMIPDNQDFTSEIIDYLLETISSNPLFEEQQKKGKDKRSISTQLPLIVMSAIKEILSSELMEHFVKIHFAELFSVLLILMSSYIGASAPLSSSGKSTFIPNRDPYNINPAKVAYDALVMLTACAKYDSCVEVLQSGIKVENCESLNSPILEMITSLTKALCSTQPRDIAKILKNINRFAGSNVESQRITVITFVAEVLNGCVDEPIVDSITSSLLSSLTDTSPAVRQSSLRGLASVCNLDKSLVSRHYESVLTALIQGLDDDDAAIHTGIVLEAINGLSKLLPVLPNSLFSTTFVSIAIRIKPYFEKEDVKLRSSSLKLFGELACQINEDDVTTFNEQVKGNLVCLLLHLGENELAVVKACKYSLRAIGPLLKSENVAQMTKEHLIDEGNLRFSEFLTQIVKILVREFPELMSHFLMTALSYSKSTWPEVRAGAAIFIGMVYSQMKEFPDKMPEESISCRLLVLLKDTDPTVRAKAAYSLSLLF